MCGRSRTSTCRSRPWFRGRRCPRPRQRWPMRLGEPARMQSAINVTPLVDVVLVLLIIFMVVAPQMRPGPEVQVPTTAKPREQGDARDRILVTIDQHGELWIDDQPIAVGSLGEGLRAAAGVKSITKVVIQGDARLRFG